MKQTIKNPTNAEIIRKRREDVLVRQDGISLLIRILFLVLAAWFLLTRVFFITQASGNSMFPAIKDGDLIIGFRLQQEYAKNDVVVCQVNGQQYIGRILARQTDTVMLDESGSLLVNGTTQIGEILYPTYAGKGLEYPLTVPENHVFILGDYRTQAVDSRNFGPVPMDQVVGKVITILRRRGL